MISNSLNSFFDVQYDARWSNCSSFCALSSGPNLCCLCIYIQTTTTTTTAGGASHYDRNLNQSFTPSLHFIAMKHSGSLLTRKSLQHRLVNVWRMQISNLRNCFKEFCHQKFIPKWQFGKRRLHLSFMSCRVFFCVKIISNKKIK